MAVSEHGIKASKMHAHMYSINPQSQEPESSGFYRVGGGPRGLFDFLDDAVQSLLLSPPPLA
jgi:hypothetical protein